MEGNDENSERDGRDSGGGMLLEMGKRAKERGHWELKEALKSKLLVRRP